ncbi:hypothetical protein, partial [Acanthopleuribacter pedis]
MWQDKLIPHLKDTAEYSRQDILDLLKTLNIAKRRLPGGFLKVVGWQDGDKQISGQILIAGLRAYRPVRGRRPTAAEKRKCISRKVRITKKEREFISLVAKIHHLSANQFVLMRLLDTPLPRPQEGRNIEISHFLKRISDDLSQIEDVMRDGRIEPIDLSLLSSTRTALGKIQVSIAKIHRIEFEPPPFKETRSVLFNLMVSKEENEILVSKLKHKKFSSAFRENVFFSSIWEYCRPVSSALYNDLKSQQWYLSKVPINLRLGIEADASGIIEDINTTLVRISRDNAVKLRTKTIGKWASGLICSQARKFESSRYICLMLASSPFGR